MNDTVKLTVIHEIDRADSRLIEAVSGGWPAILSSLKSLLETGQALERTRDLKNACEAAARGDDTKPIA